MKQLDEMQTFVLAVENGSFAGAARRLLRSPSAVSKVISGLEARLGARLLIRTTRMLRPTDAGRIYYERCRRILASIEEAEAVVSQAHGTLQGHIRIGGLASFARSRMLSVIAEFMERHPKMTVELVQRDRRVDLTEDDVDVAIVIGEVLTKSVECVRLVPSRRVVCAAPSYLERHGAPVRVRDLSEHNCLAFNALRHLNVWEFIENGEVVSFEVDGVLTANSFALLRQAALEGLGICRFSDFVVGPDLESGALVPVLPDRTAPGDRQICAIYPRQSTGVRKVETFVQFLKEILGTP
ncbi:MAG: LysR substrate-binding domain-containing protein [Methyloligellaceae bacterium]